jgi:cytochrome c-type biogenesis protein CcmF
VRFTDLGMIGQALALVFALYAIAASVLGALRHNAALVASGRRAVLVVAGFLVIAAASLLASFLLRDFGAVYVAEHSSRAMPWYYATAAFYGGQEGSLLYWTTMLAIFSSIAVLLHRRAPVDLMPYVVAVLMTIDGFFLVVLNFVSTPFARTAVVPNDGAGLNPILQDPGMLVHPPTLLMGYMSWSVPFAFAVAAMISGRLDSGWLRAIRRWMLVSWSIQTAGLLLGAWWAYHVLGWGGYWGWDPVENAALLPWLTATAFLHSSMVQERRGTLKVWNISLILATFALSIFGTFEVRSGIISSVHSFSYSSIGPYFLGFLAVILAFSIGLFIYRLPRLRPEHEFESIVSREGSFLLNNFLLTGIAFATFWGTIFPIISAVFRGQTMTVGTAFYQQVNGPLFLVLLLATGIGPLLAWRRASAASIWRNLRWSALVAAICALVLPLLGVTNIWANVGFAVCAFTTSTILYELWRGMRVRHAHGEAYPRALVMLVSRHRQR